VLLARCTLAPKGPKLEHLEARVTGRDGKIMPGLYAAGEAAGFGGMHGYRSLQGAFLGGGLFSGRNAGRAAAKAS
jgi:predicted oxidoreductase